MRDTVARRLPRALVEVFVQFHSVARRRKELK
jgi:hypothetical protein